MSVLYLLHPKHNIFAVLCWFQSLEFSFVSVPTFSLLSHKNLVPINSQCLYRLYFFIWKLTFIFPNVVYIHIRFKFNLLDYKYVAARLLYKNYFSQYALYLFVHLIIKR